MRGVALSSARQDLRVRASTVTARPPDLRRLSLRQESFAVHCPLALLGNASYPVAIRQPAASLRSSFTPSSRTGALRFASLAVTSSRQDVHLQLDAHARRTMRNAPDGGIGGVRKAGKCVRRPSGTWSPPHCHCNRRVKIARISSRLHFRTTRP